MRSLLDAIKNKRTNNDGAASSQKGKQMKKSTRKIQLGWKNYQTDKRDYISVRLSNGGGSRNLDVNNEANLREIKDLAIAEFFPQSTSKLGNVEDFTFKVGNFKGEEICHHEEMESFTIQKYYQACKMSKARLYLLSSKSDDLNESPIEEIDADSDGTDLLENPFGEVIFPDIDNF